MEKAKFKMDLEFIVSAIALITGILFYIIWGITYNVWADVGIYSVSIVLIGFGVLGLLFCKIEEKK
ncbi:MAG TPA: hypothetical protein ENI33_05190 [Thermoplasmatales archaeon]|nr:hypothetical protein [Thermoplasmatales archaeon]